MSLLTFLPGRSATDAPLSRDWHATDPWVRFGNRTIIYMCGGLLAASMLFSVSGAVVSAGTVAVEGEYKAIQHLEGGIVSKILVHNGERVDGGQVLVKLDDTQARASMAAISAKVAELAIQEARLLAERDRKDGFEMPPDLGVSEADAAAVLEAQRALFTARRTAYLGQKKVLAEKQQQAASDLAGATSQLNARMKERDLNERELLTVRPLYDRGYVSQQRLGPLERENARIHGDIGNLKAELAKLKAARTELDERLAQVDKEYSQQSAEELQKVQMQLAEQSEARKAIADKLARTEVRAPVAGIVHAIAVHTEGGVIQPASTLMQIVPEGRQLLVESRIPPQSIDSVKQGHTATVRFSSFDAHTTPRLQGVVRSVSAAQMTDQEGRSFFTVQVEVPPAEITKLAPGQRLVPGMPAEVFVETTSRSILSYFLKPLGDMMARTFRER